MSADVQTPSAIPPERKAPKWPMYIGIAIGVALAIASVVVLFGDAEPISKVHVSVACGAQAMGCFVFALVYGATREAMASARPVVLGLASGFFAALASYFAGFVLAASIVTFFFGGV